MNRNTGLDFTRELILALVEAGVAGMRSSSASKAEERKVAGRKGWSATDWRGGERKKEVERVKQRERGSKRLYMTMVEREWDCCKRRRRRGGRKG